MQPNVTPGAVLELHAAKANGGLSPGVNSPLTTTFFDTSGNGNHGTLQTFAGTEASGYAGTGTAADPYRLTFDGVDDRVSVHDAGTLNPISFTADAWLIGSASASLQYAIANRPASGASGWSLYLANTSRYVCQIAKTDGTWAYVNASNLGAVEAGSLCHVALTYDGANLRTYFNGSLYWTRPLAYLPKASSADFLIGSLAFGSYPFAGSVLAVRLYPFALTPEQVAANYAAGLRWLSRRPSGLLVYQSGRSAAAWQ